jgi:hypothetical protein
LNDKGKNLKSVPTIQGPQVSLLNNEQVYLCEDCERVIALSKVSGKKVPECCGRPMVKVPMAQCTKPPASAEDARFADEDGPCRTD